MTKRPNGTTEWTQALIGEAVAILRQHEELPAALAEISKFMGGEVTRSSLRCAFARFGVGAPTGHLASSGGKARGRGAPPRLRDLSPKDRAAHDRDSKVERVEYRHVGRTELILEGLTKAMEGRKPFAVHVGARAAPPKMLGPAEVCWGTLSDIHVGSMIESSSVGGINSHEHKDFHAKLARWTAGMTAFIDERLRCAPVDHVVFAILGDVCDGADIFRGQAWEQTDPILEQLVDGSDYLAAALCKIAATFPRLRFAAHGISGNHGRIGKPNQQPFKANFDRILYAMMERAIKAAGVRNLAFAPSDTWFALVDTLGVTHLLMHGDFVRSLMGSPIHGLKNAVHKYSQIFQRQIHVAHIGHVHAEQASSHGAGDVLVNGSFPGRNAYSLRELMEGNVPCQMAYSFTANGLTTSRKLFLVDRSELQNTPTVHCVK